MMTNASKKAPIFKFNLLGTRRLFKDRLELLCAIAQQLPAQCQLPWLAFIRRLVESELPNIRVPVDEAPEVGVGRSGRIEILRGNPSKFRISDQFCQLLLHLKTQLKLDAQHFNDVIDNFILHELVHRGQGFEEGGHRGLAQRAARVLDSLDYQADAWAVLIHFSLANIAPEKFGAIGQSRWNLYARLIRAVLYQMYLFRLVHESDDALPRLRSATEAREATMDTLSLGRTASWHYQYHRALVFNQNFDIGDFQLLVRPEFSFRNATQGRDKLNANWPKCELEANFSTNNIDPVVITGVTRFGLSSAKKFTPGDPEDYVAAFNGFFSCNVGQVEGSERFFRRFFAENPEFTLKNADPPPNSTPPRLGLIADVHLDNALVMLAEMFAPSLPFAPTRAHLTEPREAQGLEEQGY